MTDTGRVRVLADGVSDVPGIVSDGQIWVDAGAVADMLGWHLRPEGLCRGDVCVPLPPRGDVRRMVEGRVDLVALAALLGRLCVIDTLPADGPVVAVALDPESRRQALRELEAPDFTLPDLEGVGHSLSEWGGRKRLLMTFASWCGCRYELPGWQALHDELAPSGFSVIGVAIDNAPQDVSPWAEGITFPVLYDADHLLTELYAISNVPTVVWIDGEDRIVRPNGIAFGSDLFTEFTGVTSGPHFDAVRDWVRDGIAPMAPEAAGHAVTDLTEDEVRARLHFRIGVDARRRGDDRSARRQLEKAVALAPYDWTVRRAAMPLLGKDPFGQEFLTLYDEWVAQGMPYHGILADTSAVSTEAAEGAS